MCYCLENSTGVLQAENGCKPFLDHVLEKLSVQVPFFKHGVVVAKAQAVIPTRRTRCWLRGVRLDALLPGDGENTGTVALPPLLDGLRYYKVKLEDVLIPGLPYVRNMDLAPTQMDNLNIHRRHSC